MTLVNLSSIIYYGKYKNHEYYKNFIEKIHFNNKGVSITYLYDIDVLRGNGFFQDRGFSLLQFEDDRTGVMVYKKIKSFIDMLFLI